MLAYLNAANYYEISKGFDLRAALYRKNFQEFIAKQTDHMTRVKKANFLFINNLFL